MRHLLNTIPIIHVRDNSGATPLLKLSPSGLVPVCSGDQLEVICNTTETFLTWDILWIPDGATTAVNHGGQIINHQSPHDETSCYVIINSVFFNISRISPVNTLPMISRLVISPANSSINGTEVVCRDVIQSYIYQSATIHVLNEGDSLQGMFNKYNSYAWIKSYDNLDHISCNKYCNLIG